MLWLNFFHVGIFYFFSYRVVDFLERLHFFCAKKLRPVLGYIVKLVWTNRLRPQLVMSNDRIYVAAASEVKPYGKMEKFYVCYCYYQLPSVL